MDTFIGRQLELKLLSGLFKKNTASLVVVYGRRRVGKSRLIAEFASQYRFLSFSGIFPEKNTTNQDQLDEFSRRFKEQYQKDIGPINDWGDAFYQLASETRDQKTVILLDEISWMGFSDPNFLGKLKNAWDMEFKKNSQLVVVLCGSASLWIEKKILANRGFYGRISLKLRLKELPLHDCAHFWGDRDNQISDYEKFKILAVTGGIPKYLEEIRPDQSADENIRRLCFSRHGQLYNDYPYIFLSLLERDNQCYQQIVEALSQTTLERSQLIKDLNQYDSLSNYLEELSASGFLSRDFTWNLKSGNVSQLSKYRLSDNYLRFYIKYIKPNIPRIEKDRFEQHSISSLPGWASIMGLQIENLVLNNMDAINKLIGIYPDEIINEGPFFQRKTKRYQGCQIDYLVQAKFGILYLCEVKFTLKGVKSNVITDVQEKINRLALPKHFSVKPILIHVGDVYDDVIESNYFAKIIDLSELLE